MVQAHASAPGKIILSGEYAVVFGHPGIAVPSALRLHVTHEDGTGTLQMHWPEIEENASWKNYLKSILDFLDSPMKGRLSIENAIPLGKGMGSSTALVIALTRALWSGSDEEKRQKALAIEHTVNPGHSGIDFAVIWEECPLVFQKGKMDPYSLPAIGEQAMLIDTGSPTETTAELVAWVKERSHEANVQRALASIGHCTERILRGDPLLPIVREHHRAQSAFGVIPDAVKSWIASLEARGGAGKIIGAGGRGGGGGVILALHEDRSVVERLLTHQPTFSVLQACDVF